MTQNKRPKNKNSAPGEERNFQNCQRLLEHHTYTSTWIMGMTFALQPMGLAGIYALHKERYWLFGLSCVMLAVTWALHKVWKREHQLGVSAVEYLRDKLGVEFPEEWFNKREDLRWRLFYEKPTHWIGETTKTWTIIYRVCYAVWIIAAFAALALFPACCTFK